MRHVLIGITILFLFMQAGFSQDEIGQDWYAIVKVLRNLNLSDELILDSLSHYCDNQNSIYSQQVVALAEYETGHIYRARLSDNSSALNHYRRSYLVYSKDSTSAQSDLAKTAFYTLRCAMATGQDEVVTEYFNVILNMPFTHRYTARAFKDMSEYFRRQGDLVLSNTCMIQAFAQINELNPTEVINLHIEELNLRLEESDVHELMKCTTKIPQLEKVIDSTLIARPQIRETAGHYYQNIALALEEIGDLQSAIEYNNIALNYLSDSISMADIYNNLGRLHIRNGNYSTSRKYILRSRKIYSESRATLKLAGTYDNLGSIEYYLGNFQESIRLLDTAQSMASDTPIEQARNLDQLAEQACNLPTSNRIELLVFIPDKARSYQGLYFATQNKLCLDTAMSLIDIADHMIDDIRQLLGNNRSHLDWRKKARSLYDRAVVIAVLAGNSNKALHYMDRGKSLLIEESFREKELINLTSLSVQNEIRHTVAKIDSLSILLLNNKHDSIYSAINTRLVYEYQKLNEQKQSLCLNSPKFCENVYRPQVSPLNQIQSHLTPNQTLLSYFLTGDTVLCARIDQNGNPKFIFLGSRNTLDSLLTVYSGLWKRDISSLSADDYVTHVRNTVSICNELYKFLIEPLGDLPSRVIIIPDENLHILNFDILIEPGATPETPLSKQPFLVRSHAITYGHSITTWTRMSENTPNGNVLVGMVPEFAGTKYNALNYSKTVLPNVAKHYDFVKRFGNQATRENLEKDSENALLHFETHAVLNDSISNFSFLLLNKPNGDLDTFFLQDAYHLSLPGSFVAIPNCETHRGNLARGEGVISLARAFTYSGASSIITSLWVVKEQPSARIMDQFYTNMSDGMTKDVALQQAKLQYMKSSLSQTQAHPYVWASLIHIGNNTPIEGRNNSRYLILAALAVLAIGLILNSRRRSIKRQETNRAA